MQSWPHNIALENTKPDQCPRCDARQWVQYIPSEAREYVWVCIKCEYTSERIRGRMIPARISKQEVNEASSLSQLIAHQL